MSKELLNWLTKRREINVVNMIQDHLVLSTGCAEEITHATKKMISGDRQGALVHISKLNEKEKEADLLRGKIMDELSKGEFSPTQREDLMHLIKRVDMVADYARGAGRGLKLLSFEKYPNGIKDITVVFVEKTLDNVSMLKKAVQSLTSSIEEVIKYADMVERIEEEVDEIHGTVRGLIKDLPSNTMTTGEFILLSQFFYSLEMINDSCEDSVDYLRLIIGKLR